jgi:two-component system LytT family response regulator
MWRIDAAELVSVEAQGNYVLLQQKSEIAEKLGPHGFIRIHRSVLVKVAFVYAIETGLDGDYLLRTRTGKRYRVTRTYRNNLKGLAQFWIGTDRFDSS